MKVYRHLTGEDDAALCHRVTCELGNGWALYGQPTLAYDQARGCVICGQVVTKNFEGVEYDPPPIFPRSRPGGPHVQR